MKSTKGKPFKIGITRPPTYTVLQDSIEKQGAKSAQSFAKLSKPAQKAHLKEMQKFAASISLATDVQRLSDKQRSGLVTNIAGNNKRKFGDAFTAGLVSAVPAYVPASDPTFGANIKKAHKNRLLKNYQAWVWRGQRG